MTVKISGTDGIDTAQLRAPDGDPVAMTIDNAGKVAFPATPVPAFWAILTPASQGIGSLNAWGIPVLTKQFDTNNCFQSGRFTPTVEGYYQVNASCNFTAASGLVGLAVRIVKSGNPLSRSYAMSATPVDGGISVSSLIYMNGTTDWIELQGLVTAGVTPAFSPLTTAFSASLVRAA
jgi:hypothetical protein